MDPVEVDAGSWAQALQGDSRALGVLFDRHHAVIFRAMRSRGATVDEAEEAMAVAFFELWRRREAVRLVDESVLPWLLVTAHNAHRNRVRTAPRHRAALVRLRTVEDSVDPSEAAERRVNDGARSSALRLALRRRPSSGQFLHCRDEKIPGRGLRESYLTRDSWWI